MIFFEVNVQLCHQKLKTTSAYEYAEPLGLINAEREGGSGGESRMTNYKFGELLVNKLVVGKRPLIIGVITVLIGVSLLGGDGTSGNLVERTEQRVNQYLLYGNSSWYNIKSSEIPIVNRLGAGFVRFFEDRLIRPIIGYPEQLIDKMEPPVLFGNGGVASESLGELAGESLGGAVLLLPFYLGFKQVHKRSEKFRKFVEKVK